MQSVDSQNLAGADIISLDVKEYYHEPPRQVSHIDIML